MRSGGTSRWTTGAWQTSTSEPTPKPWPRELMHDYLLHPDLPHCGPQSGGRRQTLNLTMFSHHRDRKPAPGAVVTNRDEVAQRLKRGFRGADERLGPQRVPVRDRTVDFSRRLHLPGVWRVRVGWTCDAG
ncbi:MAG: hypothetical protein R2789_19010 [Microthrixaceae bacterium]